MSRIINNPRIHELGSRRFQANGTNTEGTGFVNLETNNCWFDKLVTDNCDSTQYGLDTGNSSSIRLDTAGHKLYQTSHRWPQKYPSDTHKLVSRRFDKDNVGSIGLGTGDPGTIPSDTGNSVPIRPDKNGVTSIERDTDRSGERDGFQSASAYIEPIRIFLLSWRQILDISRFLGSGILAIVSYNSWCLRKLRLTLPLLEFSSLKCLETFRIFQCRLD